MFDFDKEKIDMPSLMVKRNRTFKPLFSLKSGDKCTVNKEGDLYCIYESREFIDAPCIFEKITKAGLIHVSLEHDRKKTYSVPMKNISLRT